MDGTLNSDKHQLHHNWLAGLELVIYPFSASFLHLKCEVLTAPTSQNSWEDLIMSLCEMLLKIQCFLSTGVGKTVMRSSGTVVGQMGPMCGKASFCIMPSTCHVLNEPNSPITWLRGNLPLHSAPSTVPMLPQRWAKREGSRSRAAHLASVCLDSPAASVCLWRRPASPRVFSQCFSTPNSPAEPP